MNEKMSFVVIVALVAVMTTTPIASASVLTTGDLACVKRTLDHTFDWNPQTTYIHDTYESCGYHNSSDMTFCEVMNVLYDDKLSFNVESVC